MSDFKVPVLTVGEEQAEWERLRNEVRTREQQVIRARAIAKARGEAYDPKRHGPFDAPLPPRQRVKAEMQKTDADALLEKLRKEWEGRAPVRTGRHLEAIPKDRESVRRVASL